MLRNLEVMMREFSNKSDNSSFEREIVPLHLHEYEPWQILNYVRAAGINKLTQNMKKDLSNYITNKMITKEQIYEAGIWHAKYRAFDALDALRTLGLHSLSVEAELSPGL
ncbi:MAG: hypothetical protein KKD75_00660 [Nanoarchaeota archaeon]|nr:hypothetical protein [Nanoarchaeota archaeon]MBU1632181.1 hypothetical protein [Nanoarchaeota archaeon]MBU1875502.1 hypothetical protein [Nanoarchaeota archaeon]